MLAIFKIFNVKTELGARAEAKKHYAKAFAESLILIAATLIATYIVV